MNRKIIISLAPTGSWGSGDGNPVTPTAIASDVIRSIDAGATVVHLHSRNEQGNLTSDLVTFNESVNRIKEARDLILEASTGGLSDLTTDERVLPIDNSHTELGSLNIGSLNFGDQVYCNSVPAVRKWISRMKSMAVKPSLEIFDTGHLQTALHLIEEGLVTPPYNFSFIFDVNWGMPWDPDLLQWLIHKLPVGGCWGAIFVGSHGFDDHLAAAAGATFLRVGFEDSRWLDMNIAETNVELVLAFRKKLEQAGYGIATVDEARKILLQR